MLIMQERFKNYFEITQSILKQFCIIHIFIMQYKDIEKESYYSPILFVMCFYQLIKVLCHFCYRALHYHWDCYVILVDWMCMLMYSRSHKGFPSMCTVSTLYHCSFPLLANLGLHVHMDLSLKEPAISSNIHFAVLVCLYWLT